MLTSHDIRTRFLHFFEKRGHAILPSASLVPLNDPSVLFNTAGMQPLVPYLLGEPHPKGKRLVNSQKCVRTQDIEEVGDNTHDTFFEMLGNWSLGDYFKKEAITWSYDFLTSKEEGLGLDPKRLYVTVFGGNEDAPKDSEAYEIWKGLVPEHRIYFMTKDAKGKEPNWWAAGENGPCGPDSEMFYDVTKEGLGDLTKEEYLAADDAQQVVEIWNDVFMEYRKEGGKVVGKLPSQNVDTGAGLERLTMVIQEKDNIFETDLFAPLMEVLRTYAKGEWNEKAARIVADHIRTAVLLVSDGVTPSKTDQGYILRRLVRRAAFQLRKIGADDPEVLRSMIRVVPDIYKEVYPEIGDGSHAVSVIEKEISDFYSRIEEGMKVFEKLVLQDARDGSKVERQSLDAVTTITAEDMFLLQSTYGFPFELTREIMEEKKMQAEDGLDEKLRALVKQHQDLSRSGSEQKFKGGLADTSEATVRLHTAHHLLLRALQIVLGPEVHQRGSNITSERLRIDFACPQKLTDEQKREVERIVNEQITNELPVIRTEMSREEAEALGAEHEFGAKYPDRVSVYSVGPKDATQEDPKFAERFSIEFCGGPHVENTRDLGHFRILKEEAVAQGVRRIKAVLE